MWDALRSEDEEEDGDVGAEEAEAPLDLQQYIEATEISRAHATPEDNAALLGCLHLCAHLEVLDLPGCEIGEAGAEAVAAALPCMPAFKVLKLSRNKLEDEGTARLAKALGAPGAVPQLQEISLPFNFIGDKGAVHLAQALGALGAVPQLQLLNLERNVIDDEGGKCLARALSTPGAVPQLQMLLLTTNRIGAEGAACLAQALSSQEALPRLQMLAIGDNRVSNPVDEGALEMLQAAWVEAGRPSKEDGKFELQGFPQSAFATDTSWNKGLWGF